MACDRNLMDSCDKRAEKPVPARWKEDGSGKPEGHCHYRICFDEAPLMLQSPEGDMEISAMDHKIFVKQMSLKDHPQCLTLTRLFDIHDLDEGWIILIYGLSQTEVRPFPVIMLFIIHSRVRIPGTTLRFACSGVLILSFFASLSLYFS